MHEELVSRSDALKQRFAVLRTIRGSGHHDEDRNPAKPERFLAPQKNGLPPASDHIVCFRDDLNERMVFVGQDAKAVFGALQEWYDANRHINLSSATGTHRKLFLDIIPRLTMKDGVVEIRHSVWNDVLSVLDEAKVGLQCRAIVEDGSPMPGE